MRNKFLILVLALIGFNIFFPPTTFAQNPSNGVSVTPSVMRIDLAEDPEEFILYYKNSTGEPVQLSFKAQDFTELEEGWKVKFLEEKDAKNYSYSLSSWLEFEKQTLDLNPNEERELKVKVDKDRLSPGGHYATVLAEINPKNMGEPGQIEVKQLLSSLVFVRSNTGQEIEKLTLSSSTPSQNPFLDIPKSMILRLNNSGNTDLIPYGLITIKDPLNRVVGKGVLNEESAITLPETIRRYDVKVGSDTKAYIPGLYKAEINIEYGKENKKIIRSITFFSLGDYGIFIIVGFLIIATTLTLLVLKLKSLKRHR